MEACLQFPGCRFRPQDDELIEYYLKPKIKNESLPGNFVHQINVYEHGPEELHGMFGSSDGEEACYFLTERTKKHKGDIRPNRFAGNGYWKASTGIEKNKIFNPRDDHIGNRRTLVYWEGKPPNGQKTSWIMQEYMVVPPPIQSQASAENDIKFDDWVLCKIYMATRGSGSKRRKETKRHHPYRSTPPRISSLEGSQSSVAIGDESPSVDMMMQLGNVQHDSIFTDTINLPIEQHLNIEEECGFGENVNGLRPLISMEQQMSCVSNGNAGQYSNDQQNLNIANWPQNLPSSVAMPIPQGMQTSSSQQDMHMMQEIENQNIDQYLDGMLNFLSKGSLRCPIAIPDEEDDPSCRRTLACCVMEANNNNVTTADHNYLSSQPMSMECLATIESQNHNLSLMDDQQQNFSGGLLQLDVPVWSQYHATSVATPIPQVMQEPSQQDMNMMQEIENHNNDRSVDNICNRSSEGSLLCPISIPDEEDDPGCRSTPADFNGGLMQLEITDWSQYISSPLPSPIPCDMQAMENLEQEYCSSIQV